MFWIKRATNRPWVSPLLVWMLGASFYVVWALLQGQDANWDLQNYHDYSAYALLNWRYPLDVGPGAFQAYFNPLPYVIPFVLRHGLPPRLAAAGIALLQAAVIPVAWAIAVKLLPATRQGRVALPALAAAVGATASVALAEVGTSFADLMLASLVLGGLLALLHADVVEAGARRTVTLLASGFLVGAACGLKLTNLVFVPGLALAALFPLSGGWRPKVRGIGAVGLGGMVGFLLTGGVWAIYLWVTLNNPIFPEMNTVFHSSSAAVSDFQDKRFVPRDLPDALSYPWRIARGEHPTAEIPFADGRLLLALSLGIVAVATTARSRPGAASLPLLRSCCFLAVSLAVWLKLFAIERYAVGLEILAGTLAIPLVARLASSRTILPAATAISALLLCSTRPADFWHRPWSNPFVPSLPMELKQPAAYVVAFYPDGYWASALPAASRFYTIVRTGLATGGVLRNRILAGLRRPPGGRIRTLGPDIPMAISTREELASLGLAPAAPCVRAKSLWWVDTIFCSASIVGSRPLAAADVDLGQRVDFSDHGSGWIYLLQGWLDASAKGVSMAGSSATLVMAPGKQDRLLVLELAMSVSTPTFGEIVVGEQPPATWSIAKPGVVAMQAVCVRVGMSHANSLTIRFSVNGKEPSFLLHTMRLRLPHPDECGT